MSFPLPSSEQIALSDAVAGFLAAEFPLARLRTSGAADTGRWRELADLGLFGISLAQAQGGLGQTWVDEVLAAREAGRQLLSPALPGTVLAVQAATHSGRPDLRDALQRGERAVGIVVRGTSTGCNVIEGGDGLALLLEENRLQLLDLAGCKLAAADCIDETVQLLRFGDIAPASTAASELPGAVVLADTEASELALAASLLTAAMLCGILEGALTMAADYARTRVQFGRPIGAFQAVKHRCADMALAAELCWSQTLQAAAALSNGHADAAFHVQAAKLLAGEEALNAARANIQIHGGMGFSDEVDAHRLLKRAHVLQQLCGDPRALAPTLIDLPLEL